MTSDEYQRRLRVIAKAMQLYGEAAQGNTTVALQMLNEPGFEIFLPAEAFQGLTGSEFDRYERIICPECGEVMNLRRVNPNEEHINTQLVCSNPLCDTVLDSELTVDDWRKELSGGH